MDIKISDMKNHHIQNNNKSDLSDSNQKVDNKASGQSHKLDSVDISQLSGQLSKLKEKITDLPEVDINRITKLKEKIANGEYVVNSKTIAQKLQNFEKLFIPSE